VKLPAPVFGTDEQAGPKSVIDAADPLALALIDGVALADGAAEVEDPDELQAAALSTRPAPIAVTMMRFMITPSGFFSSMRDRSGHGDDDGVPPARAVGE
jgi:hypothetical protein